MSFFAKMKGAGGVSLEDLRARYPGAETYVFGNGAALSGELLALVKERFEVAEDLGAVD